MATRAQLDFIKTFSPVMYGHGRGIEAIGYVVGRVLRAMGASRPVEDGHWPLIEAVQMNPILGDRDNRKVMGTFAERVQFINNVLIGFDEPMAWHEANSMRIRYEMPAYI